MNSFVECLKEVYNVNLDIAQKFEEVELGGGDVSNQKIHLIVSHDDIQLGVICILAHPKSNEDVHYSLIFHTFAKIGRLTRL